MKIFHMIDSLPLLSFIMRTLIWKVIFVNALILITIFVRFYHAGTVCARRRARLLVCFDRPVGWKQTVMLHLIKLMRLMCSNDGGYI